MEKIKIIFWRELLTTIKRPAYIIMTLGIPLFFITIGVIAAIPSYVFLAEEFTDKNQFIGIVDNNNFIDLNVLKEFKEEDEHLSEVLHEALGGQSSSELMEIVGQFIKNVQFKKYTNLKRGQQALLHGKISLLYNIPADYIETGTVEVYKDKLKLFSSSTFFMRWLLRANLLKDSVTKEVMHRVQDPTILKEYKLDTQGNFIEDSVFKEFSPLIIPYIVSGIMVLTIFIPSGYLLQSISQEKESKIIEILISSVTPFQLLVGKMFGLGCAGLIQATIWLIFMFLPLLVGISILEIAPLTIFLYFLYIILGFMLYGSILAGIGAISSPHREGTQIASILSTFSLIPIIIIPLIVRSPNSFVVNVLSYFPLTTPVTMIIKISTRNYDLIEVLLTTIIMAITTFIVINLSAKLFKTGMLMQGQEISIPNLIKNTFTK